MSKKHKPLVNHAISAVSQDDFFALTGGSLSKGTSFEFDDFDAICMTITDDDKKLDTYKHKQHGSHDRHDDQNQTASAHDVDFGEVDAGKLIKLRSDTGDKYEMVQLVTEDGGKFWTFVGDIPDEDETLTIRKVYDHKKVNYKDGLGVKYVIAGDDELETDEETVVFGNLLDNDCVGFSSTKYRGWCRDDDGIDKDDLRVVAVEGGTVGSSFTVISALGNEALVTVNRDGSVRVDPVGGFDSLAQGETDTITLDYTLGAYRTEGKGWKTKKILETDDGELTITVNGVNDGPQAADDSYSGTGTITVAAAAGVLANDTDVDGDTLVASVVSGPANGTLTLNADGSLTYVPTSLFSGDVSFTYAAADPFGGSSTATASISIAAAAPPLAESYATDEDNPLVIGAGAGVLANDPVNAGDALTASVLTGPEHGSLVLNADGSFTYVPDGDFNGADAFTYEVTDSASLTRESVAEITVAAVNDGPLAADDSYSGSGTVSVDAATGVLANDSDIDGDTLTAAVVTGPANGTLTLDADGSFTYVSTSLFSGDVSFTYEASDPSGATSTATASISIAPAASPLAESYTTDEDAALVVGAGAGVLANDTVNAGDALTASLVTGPDNGTLTLNEDGSFTYTPDDDFNGSDAFTYAVTDSAGLTRESVAEITIDPVNDAPFFDFTTFQGAPLVGRFSVGDPVAGIEAVDIDGDTLVFRIESKNPATNDVDLFELLSSEISPTRAFAEVVTSDLFPQTDAALRAASGPDNKLEITLFVSDGEFEASFDLGPGSLTAG